MSRILQQRATKRGCRAWLVLLALATVVDGVLAGASLDQSIKQLPARRRMGNLAFSAYSRASDQANGVIWYALLGIGGAVLTLASSIWVLVAGPASARPRPVLLAGALAMAHSFTTARAAPINFSQRKLVGDEAALGGVFDRFERWQTARAALQLATFLAVVWEFIIAARTSGDA